MRSSTAARRGGAARRPAFIAAARLLIAAPVLAAAAVAVGPGSGAADLGAEVAAPVPTAQSFESFLDSLQAESTTVSRAGVRAEWPAADSVAALVASRGPAAADSLGLLPARRRLAFDLDPDLVAMNRVEGARAGARLELGNDLVTLAGAAAYAISAEEWRHREELLIDMKSGGELAYRYGDLVFPYGDATPEAPNSIYTLFAGADDLDYLRRTGWQVEWRIGTADRRSFRLAYSVVDERSEPARTDWNLFGRDRGPRPNPAVTAGSGRRLLVAGRTTAGISALRGALVTAGAEAEIAGYGFGGDFDYDRYRLEFAADFHALARDDGRLRLAVGGARHELPVQSRYYLGGPDVLRAYRVHEFAGDRVAAAALDYLIGTDPLARLGLRWAQLQLIPFGEIGAAWFDGNGRGVFSTPETGDWRSDLGLGLQRNVFAGATVRFDFAWRLDRSAERLTTRFAFKAPLFDRFGEEERPSREERREREGRREPEERGGRGEGAD